MRHAVLSIAALLSVLAPLASTSVPPSGADLDALGPRTGAVDLAAYRVVRYVAPYRGSDSQGDGSRTRPWATVRYALTRANATSERRWAVLVAAGTYRTVALPLRPYVDLFGGFSAPGWERDLQRFRTVLDAAGRDRLLIGANHARLDGFVLRGGRSRTPGGALLCDRTSPTLTNNTFVNNGTRTPTGYLQGVLHQIGTEGGAVACLNYAAPRIQGNIFVGNTTEVGGGGAIGLRSQSVRPREEIPPPIIAENLFIGNRTGIADTDPDRKKQGRSSNGAAISLSNALADIEGNVFVQNRAGGNSDAGGIYCEYESSPRIARNTFVGNSAEDDGGAIYSMKLSEPHIVENLFSGHRGGATVRLSKDGRARIERNVFFANPAGGVGCGNSWMLLAENTLVHNGAVGIFYSNRATDYLKPSTVRGNLVRGHTTAQVTAETPDLVQEGNRIEPPSPGRTRTPGPELRIRRVPIEAARHDPLTGTTLLRLAASPAGVGAQRPGPQIGGDDLRGIVARLGERFGLVRARHGGEWVVFGDLRGDGPFIPTVELLDLELPGGPRAR